MRLSESWIAVGCPGASCIIWKGSGSRTQRRRLGSARKPAGLPWSAGVLECWSNGVPITPPLHYSITPLLRGQPTSTGSGVLRLLAAQLGRHTGQFVGQPIPPILPIAIGEDSQFQSLVQDAGSFSLRLQQNVPRLFTRPFLLRRTELRLEHRGEDGLKLRTGQRRPPESAPPPRPPSVRGSCGSCPAAGAFPPRCPRL